MKPTCARSSSTKSFSLPVFAIFILTALIIAAPSSLSAQDAAPPPATPSSPTPASCDPGKFESQLEVLTDTAGVDFGPYLRELARKIRVTRHAAALRNEFSTSTRSCATVEFAIGKDGKLAGPKLVASSANPDFDHSALNAIMASAPFDPLPEQFPGASLSLHFRFRSNSQASQQDGIQPLSPDGGRFGSGGNLSSGSSSAGAPIEGKTYQGQPVYKVGGTLTPPKPIYRPDPAFTDYARKNKIDGVVVLKMVVTPQGNVDNITIFRKLDPGLDQNAIDAVRQWKFRPATKDGQPVAVEITAEVSFRLMK